MDRSKVPPIPAPGIPADIEMVPESKSLTELIEQLIQVTNINVDNAYYLTTVFHGVQPIELNSSDDMPLLQQLTAVISNQLLLGGLLSNLVATVRAK